METTCPHCQTIHSEPLSTHGLSFRRCPTCGKFYNEPTGANPDRIASFEGVHPLPLPHFANATGTLELRSAIVTTDATPYPSKVSALQEVSAVDAAACQPLTPSTIIVYPTIPGFRVERVIGRGGMGTVYLARQLSLDRLVALKVMSRRWAQDPVFVARFTREAYAAAQLSHPNLVQVYDIGEHGGSRYFSMEYVQGRSLADAVKSAGKIDPETAVGYILQAARGLKNAHERGMIHRDIKPDNLLLDDHGLIKVADLGLVKTPDLSRDADQLSQDGSTSGLHTIPGNMTGVRMALGTPAYMSPEQCRDAATVDHRADIYSLGCTLYVLVTGRPPFDGDTAVELMTKHAYQPLVPPEEIAKRVPRELSHVIVKMLKKHPGERYQTMAELVRTLEQWLGVHHTGRVNAAEEQICQLEQLVDSFNFSPTTQMRTHIRTGVVSACLFGAVVLTFLGQLGWAFGLAGLLLQTTLAYFFATGIARKTYLFRRLKHFSFGLSVGDYLVAIATLALFAILLWMLKLFWIWIGFGLIAIALAGLARVALDRPVEAERTTILTHCDRLLRRLRVQGLDEEQVRQFVAKYAGRSWEEFYEALFGFNSKLHARATLLRGEHSGYRERHAAWREPIVQLIDRIEHTHQIERERQLLIQVETQRNLSTGLPIRQARRLALQSAAELVKQARAIRVGNTNVATPTMQAFSGTQTNVPREPSNNILPTPSSLQFRNLIGPLLRGTLATLCLSACAVWAIQNHVFSVNTVINGQGTESLVVPGIPAEMTSWCNSANVGLAGIFLLTSLFYRGVSMGTLVLMGALITLFAHHLAEIPSVPPIRDHHVGAMLGTLIALVGYRFGER